MRWKLYRRLAGRPGLVSYLRARKYDKREFLRERLGQRNEREMLALVRAGRDVCWTEADDEAEPLITVAIPTFQRPDTLERAVASARAQTYERLDILVVGDHTDARSEQIMQSLVAADPRVRFVNLPHQGIYPTDPRMRGLVSGSTPMNVALDLAAGAWLANCDDDDELLPNHVATHLAAARRGRLEMVYSQWQNVFPAAEPGVEARLTLGGSEPLRFATIARGSVLYSTGLRFMKYELDCWRIRDPHDWNLWKRMQLAGVKIGFVPEVTYLYHHRSPSG